MKKDEADVSMAQIREAFGPVKISADLFRGNIKRRKAKIENLQWRLTELLRDAKVLLTEEGFDLENRDVYLWCLALVADPHSVTGIQDHQVDIDSFFTAKDQPDD